MLTKFIKNLQNNKYLNSSIIVDNHADFPHILI